MQQGDNSGSGVSKRCKVCYRSSTELSTRHLGSETKQTQVVNLGIKCVIAVQWLLVLDV